MKKLLAFLGAVLSITAIQATTINFDAYIESKDGHDIIKLGKDFGGEQQVFYEKGFFSIVCKEVVAEATETCGVVHISICMKRETGEKQIVKTEIIESKIEVPFDQDVRVRFERDEGFIVIVLHATRS